MSRIHLADTGDPKAIAFTRAACGQARGFYAEASVTSCVGPSKAKDINCRKCQVIHQRRIEAMIEMLEDGPDE